jgi:hypothetical protein
MMDEPITQEQLDELSRMIQPLIARTLATNPEITSVSLTMSYVLGTEQNPQVGSGALRLEIKVGGQHITPEQEEHVAELLKRFARSKMSLSRRQAV